MTGIKEVILQFCYYLGSSIAVYFWQKKEEKKKKTKSMRRIQKSPQARLW